jgi:hypothetical protein
MAFLDAQRLIGWRANAVINRRFEFTAGAAGQGDRTNQFSRLPKGHAEHSVNCRWLKCQSRNLLGDEGFPANEAAQPTIQEKKVLPMEARTLGVVGTTDRRRVPNPPTKSTALRS